jgi:hypothetical protein
MRSEPMATATVDLPVLGIVEPLQRGLAQCRVDRA